MVVPLERSGATLAAPVRDHGVCSRSLTPQDAPTIGLWSYRVRAGIEAPYRAKAAAQLPGACPGTGERNVNMPPASGCFSRSAAVSPFHAVETYTVCRSSPPNASFVMFAHGNAI